MNRSELFAAVADYLNRDNIPSTSMETWVQSLEGELNQKLRTHPRMMQRATWTQPANNAILPLPNDSIQLILLYQGADSWRQFPLGARDRAMDCTSCFVAYGDCLELFPTPGEPIDFTLIYNAALKPLDSSAATNWVSVFYSDIYLYGVLKEAAVWLKDDDRLQAWNAIFLQRVEQLILQGWDQNWTAMGEVVNA